MTTLVWTQGVSGSWFAGTNWTPQAIPATGDTLVIQSGTPSIPSGSAPIAGEQIMLGGFALPAMMIATNATFQPGVGGGSTTLTAAGGEPTFSAPNAVLRVQGFTTFDGQIYVNALNSGLTIEAVGDGGVPGNFTIDNSDLKATVLVNQESLLARASGTITNGGLFQVEGGVTVAKGVAVLLVNGVIGTSQQIDLMDKTPLVTLAKGSQFDGVFGFTEIGGARIDFGARTSRSASSFLATVT